MTEIAPSKYSEYCPICVCCVAGDPSTCPECASPRPQAGWRPLSSSSYLYLGKELDGRYIIDRFIGAGSTGEVYRAIGARVPRPFAMKIVDTRRYTGRDIESELAWRLKTEVEAMGRLRNPHIVNVYEFLQLHAHIFVLVMDFVDGLTLQERLDRVGRMPAADAVTIVRQVANGLHEAHQRGIIHRDLKPENIMIEQMPASGVFARLLDFGIAHMVDSVRVTAGFRGTPLYASPEQCKSDGVISTQSDVYSLGCVLFHLLAGRPPYVFDAPLAVMEAHISAPIPTVLEFVSRRRIPSALDQLISRMLAKNPADRPTDAGAVVRELDALSEHLTQLSTIAEVTSELGVDETETRHPDEDDMGVLDTLDHERVSVRRQRIVQLVHSVEIPDRIRPGIGRKSPQILSPGGDYAVIGDTRRQLHLVGLRPDLATISYAGSDEPTDVVCINATRGDIYGGGLEQSVYRWSLDRTTGMPLKLVDVGHAITSLDCNRLGSKLAIGTDVGLGYVYDLRTQRLERVYEGAAALNIIRFIRDTDRLLVGTAAGTLATVMTGARPRSQGAPDTILPSDKTDPESVEFELEPLDTAPISAAISPDGQVGALLESCGQIRVFNLRERTAFLRMEASYAPLSALAFAPDGNLNALGMTEQCLQLWLIRHEHLMQQLSEMSSVQHANPI